ncbi:hypothetical protein [Xanthomonas hortorum]|uniref:Uncharacterized protein n=1 Tax=Xanthomonas hortorum TaxID=56454 RepID=A0AA47EUZ8_9XANT|nr:hypothetical protein [Xanthomonas hortorum]WAH65858.1 hypothetical protein OEG85_07900 [Xanthomonas hortorum]
MTVGDATAWRQSPLGSYRIEVTAWEARMSLWVETPQIVDVRAGTVLLRFDNPCWSLETAHWHSDVAVELTLRKYPGDHRPAQVVAMLNCRDRTAMVASSTVCTFAELEHTLDCFLSTGEPAPSR